tara:strand:+ start:818 stop:1078 length:261 start_codon:yes stop_codon:yes gene_type:complete
MKNLEKISVNVYNSSALDNNSYICTIEMPLYKQVARTVRYLKKYVELQKENDLKHQRIRNYSFRASTDGKIFIGFIFSETTLALWD